MYRASPHTAGHHKPFNQGIDTDGDIVHADGEVGGRGGVNDDKNGDPGLPGVRMYSKWFWMRDQVEKNSMYEYA